MSFKKCGDAQIIEVKNPNDEWPQVDDKETETALKAAKQDLKNIGKDGNKSDVAGNKNE